MMEVVFCKILVMSITSILIIGLVMLAKQIFKNRLTASWHYYIWIFLIIRLLIPDSLSLPMNYEIPFISSINHVYESKDLSNFETNMKKTGDFKADSSNTVESDTEQGNENYILETNEVWDLAIKTGDTLNVSAFGRNYILKKIVNPVKLIDSLQ